MSNDIEHRSHFDLIIPSSAWVKLDFEIYNALWQGPETSGVLEFKCGESEEKNYQMFNKMKLPIISQHFPLTILQP